MIRNPSDAACYVGAQGRVVHVAPDTNLALCACRETLGVATTANAAERTIIQVPRPGLHLCLCPLLGRDVPYRVLRPAYGGWYHPEDCGGWLSFYAYTPPPLWATLRAYGLRGLAWRGRDAYRCLWWLLGQRP